jgi:hypothetical protein
MRRMKCIGAQSIALTATTAPPSVIKMQCRRSSSNTEHCMFVSNIGNGVPAISSVQLPLFEDLSVAAAHD